MSEDHASEVSGNQGLRACYPCERNRATDRQLWEEIYADDRWRLTSAFDASLPGWVILVPLRHLEGLHELDEEEAVDLGRLLRDTSAALVEVTGCSRTYIMLFAEAEGFSHLHLHVVPRHHDLPPEHRGPGVFAYLGVAAENQISEEARSALAAELRGALRG